MIPALVAAAMAAGIVAAALRYHRGAHRLAASNSEAAPPAPPPGMDSPDIALLEAVAAPDPFDVIPMRALAPLEQEAYAVEWAAVQRRFVDDPAAAVGSADRLASRILIDRGCPFSTLTGELCDGPGPRVAVVQNYRAAHDIAQRDDHVTNDDLGRAMSHFRLLFDELLPSAIPPGKVHVMNRNRRIAQNRAS